MIERSDKMRILSKIDEMMRYVEELQEMLPDEKEYLSDLIKRRACEKTIEVAIDSLIDVCAMIVSSEKLGFPANEENIFEILVNKKILNKALGEKLKDMKGFRNVMIHRYGHVDDEIVFHNLSHFMDDFYEFKTLVQTFLGKQE